MESRASCFLIERVPRVRGGDSVVFSVVRPGLVSGSRTFRFRSDPPAFGDRSPAWSRPAARRSAEVAPSTANLRANIMDFRGFDSSIILMLRGEIPRPIGSFPESLSQAILSRDSVSRGMGRTREGPPDPVSFEPDFPRASLSGGALFPQTSV